MRNQAHHIKVRIMNNYQAIVVKYLPCTNTRGSRWKATAKAGSVTLPYDHSLSADDGALACATALADQYGWLAHCDLVGGTLPNNYRVFVLVEKSALKSDGLIVIKAAI